jgi:hypothetical protein
MKAKYKVKKLKSLIGDACPIQCVVDEFIECEITAIDELEQTAKIYYKENGKWIRGTVKLSDLLVTNKKRFI